MKRLGWAVIVLLGCTVADEPSAPPSEGRSLSDFDPAEYEILAIDELEAHPLFVEVDGERVELASVVDGDWIVRRRDVELPLANESVGPEPEAAPEDLGLTAGSDPQEACKCTYFRQYEVPVNELVWTCFPAQGDFGHVCVQVPMVVIHDVSCRNSCGACGVVTCHDSTANAHVATPAAQYLVSSAWVPCYPSNSCG